MFGILIEKNHAMYNDTQQHNIKENGNKARPNPSIS